MSRLVEMEGGLAAHASGALWIAAHRVAIVADAHLGYAWAQRRRGQLGPVVEGGVAEKLQAMVDELKPEQVVFLGDVVHAPRPSPGERETVERTLSEVRRQTRLLLVLGNHDRSFARDYAGLALDISYEWRVNGFVAVHGDKPPVDLPNSESTRSYIVGHLHPAYGIRDDAGATQRVPVFLVGSRSLVLPAFSPFAAGFDIARGIPRAARELIGPGGIDVIAATGKRAVRLGPVAGLRSASDRFSYVNRRE